MGALIPYAGTVVPLSLAFAFAHVLVGEVLSLGIATLGFLAAVVDASCTTVAQIRYLSVTSVCACARSVRRKTMPIRRCARALGVGGKPMPSRVRRGTRALVALRSSSSRCRIARGLG